MLYRFKSKATGDILMLQPQGERFLRALGREPSAQGILEPADMAAALGALQKAMEDDERARDLGLRRDDDQAASAIDAENQQPVSLRQRLWPMVEMIERARAAGEPVVWGV